MLNVTTCKVLNESDKKYLRLFIEWIDGSEFKLLLLRPTMAPLSGEMSAVDISYYSKELSKSNDEYLEDVKNAFSGKNGEIQFYLDNDTFSWRKKRIWILGKVKVQPVQIEVITETLERLLKYHEIIQEKALLFEKENERLKDTEVKLTNDIEDMIRIKCNMEKELYRKFLLILNSKKEKIRELQEHIKNKKNHETSVFDAATDDSEDSEKEIESETVKKNTPKNVEKRKLENNSKDNANTNKMIKINSSTKCDVENKKKDKKSTLQNNQNPKPSTSKNLSIEFDSFLSSPSSESECDLELKVTDESMRVGKSCLDGTEEELEEDLFSQ